MEFKDISEVTTELVRCLQEELEKAFPQITVISAPNRQSFSDLKFLGTCPPALHVAPVLLSDIECCRDMVKMNVTWFFLVATNDCGDYCKDEFSQKIVTQLIKSLHCDLLCRGIGFLRQAGTAQPVGNIQSEQEGLGLYSYTTQSVVQLKK